MRHLILMTIFVASTSSLLSMEQSTRIIGLNNDTLHLPYIIIINDLPIYTLDIGDKGITSDYFYKPHNPNNYTASLLPGRSIQFHPQTQSMLPARYRLGMNERNDAAIINIYINAPINEPGEQYYIGNTSLLFGTFCPEEFVTSPIQFGDSIRYSIENGTLTRSVINRYTALSCSLQNHVNKLKLIEKKPK